MLKRKIAAVVLVFTLSAAPLNASITNPNSTVRRVLKVVGAVGCFAGGTDYLLGIARTAKRFNATKALHGKASPFGFFKKDILNFVWALSYFYGVYSLATSLRR